LEGKTPGSRTQPDFLTNYKRNIQKRELFLRNIFAFFENLVKDFAELYRSENYGFPGEYVLLVIHVLDEIKNVHALTIQKIFRGYQVRKTMKNSRSHSATKYQISPLPQHLEDEWKKRIDIREYCSIAMLGNIAVGDFEDEDYFLESVGKSYIWGDTLPVLEEADMRIASLPANLLERSSMTKALCDYFHFRVSVTPAVESLQHGKIDCVTLANNHIADFRDIGVQTTIKSLEQAGISFAGVGKDQEQCSKCVVLPLKSKFTSFSSVSVFSLYIDEWSSSPNSGGLQKVLTELSF
jgi:hypothetical protein